MTLSRIPKVAVTLALSAALAWSGAAGAQTTGEAAAPRTFVEALQSDTPEATLASFVDAYASADYFAVYYLLSAPAKAGFRQGIMVRFTLEPFFPGVQGMDMPGALMVEQPDSDLAAELMEDPARFFDDLMFAADRAGFLPFELGPAAEILAVETSGDEALGEIATDAEPATIRVRLIRLSSGAWRVDSVAWEGSLDGARPWAVQPRSSGD